MKKAFVTGITGQDGSYLAELLLGKGYEVHGVIRRSSSFNTERLDGLMGDPQKTGGKLKLHYGDLTDSSCLHRLLEKVAPDEVYNLGAQSHVKVSFEVPEYTADVDAIGTLRLLDALRGVGLRAKFYQASTSELFGGFPETSPQNENTPFRPMSPYGAAKLYAYWTTVNYRESYGMFACNGILFNHESPRRGRTFVTRKITEAAARIASGGGGKLLLGNLNARRDWGFAGDYVEGMWRIMQNAIPDDFVLATGKTYTVRDFCTKAFKVAGIDVAWRGEALEEVGVDIKTGKEIISIDPSYFRPMEVDCLCGDYSKAQMILGWEPKTDIDALVDMMVTHDMRSLRGA